MHGCACRGRRVGHGYRCGGGDAYGRAICVAVGYIGVDVWGGAWVG